MSHAEFAIKTFSAIFIIMGPFSIIPVYVSLTQNNTSAERNRIITKAIMCTFFVCVAFAITGAHFFKIFGISMDSFRIAGGLLLLLMSINMLQAKRSSIRHTSEEVREGVEKDDVSIFPLAIPMITGPGTLSTVVLVASEANNIFDWGVIIGSIALSSFLMMLVLKLSERTYGLLGNTGINIMTRIMGLILASLSVEYILTGIRAFFKI